MMNPTEIFPPTRAAALERLHDFAPHAGRAYGEGRNYYATANAPEAVSALSPYLRTGLLSQAEVLRSVLKYHSEDEANRFIAEVFWRSYWQGWLALRPSVWDSYLSDIKRLSNEIQTQSGLRDRWQSACLGQTGIAPFDLWAHELVRTGYLHNHARMWFASIWVHTLRLPWQLGADFFLRHLLDGCPASNTLSWKWVAGIQTIGKPYLASAENISKFTQGTFGDVPGLATTPATILAPQHPDPQPLWNTRTPDQSLRSGLILHEDALNPADLTQSAPRIDAHAVVLATDHQTPWQMAPDVVTFRTKAGQDTLSRWADTTEDTPAPLQTAAALAEWAAGNGLEQVITQDAPVGPTKTVFDQYDALRGAPPLVRVRTPLDGAAWPLATAGFFKFRKHIPNLLKLIR